MSKPYGGLTASLLDPSAPPVEWKAPVKKVKKAPALPTTTIELPNDHEAEFANDSVFDTGLHLNIDGDLLVYKACAVMDEDTDSARKGIAKLLARQVATLQRDAGADDYTLFLTTKLNFRDHFVDDYKANRDKTVRPVNLKWAQTWAWQNLQGKIHKYMEADDLLGSHQTDSTVIHSTDKDLRQIPGKHLDDSTRKVFEIGDMGKLETRGDKEYFEGTMGLYFQMLTGDSTDWIVGCGKRKLIEIKSGPNKGNMKLRRVGIGPKDAMQRILKVLVTAKMSKQDDEVAKRMVLDMILREYKRVYGQEEGLKNLEIQANLLYMIREQHGDVVRRWTYDNRVEYFDITTGETLHDYQPPSKGE